LVPLSALGALASCIIADPPIDLPAVPERRPIILRDQTVPSPTSILGYFPDSFIVPVEVDPTATIEARLFVDYDALTPDRANASFAGRQVITPALGTSDAGVRQVTLLPDELPDMPSHDECHVIEAVVAFNFLDPPFAGQGQHSPDAHGGDSVVWFYSPTGDLADCPHQDGGGIDGAYPDASSDSAPLTPEGGD
jgi:hypothetical protein